MINCKYCNMDKIQSLNNRDNKDALNRLPIKTCSLPKNIEEFEYMVNKTKIDFLM